eukprot:TRINITY_DN13071_c0_g1_i2.p1 TRINITY_DN13071_c0_g1~~TRINITY_DN13071_c0_g1_i2.p1  ORF type:complete len:369 (-),score=53.28 TRINITY_DN13071_c0_g1_i2:254-1264(-)
MDDVDEQRPLQQKMISAGKFYQTYDGHKTDSLEQILWSLRRLHGGEDDSAITVFLAGDSTLDNKHWLFNQGAPAQHWRPASAYATAINGYEHLLAPPRMVCDVAYWMNFELRELGSKAFCINTAIEATLLACRVGGIHTCVVPSCGGLYQQDVLIRDSIRSQDMLVISVGGNDIALSPSIFTVVALVSLMLTPLPVLRLLGALNPATAYFVLLFRYQVQCYAEKLTARTKPAKVAVCMVYNLDERNVDSWANCALFLLCYFCFPGMLQARMRLAFDLGTSRVRLDGTQVVPVHLAEALDGKSTGDYHHRVEPSVQGGRKMANLILHHLGLDVRTRD